MVTPGIEERVRSLPTRPGVYIMRDAEGGIIYVGKAVNLRNRVRSYFGALSGLTPKVVRMVSQLTDFDFIITDSELEALILECTLIKRYQPHYNVRLKDDKNYPYIKITLNEDWPQVLITRRILDDGARYFGPYGSSRSMRTTLDLLKKLFRYCTCNPTTSRGRPCLDYHIGRCVGCCIGAVTKEEYRDVIKQLVLFLEGKEERVLRRLRLQMEDAAERLEFERAAYLRDQIAAVENVIERQKAISPATGDQDVIALAQDKDESCVKVFFIRGGRIFGQEHFILEGAQDEEPGQILTSFVEQFYDSAAYIPPQILLQHTMEEAEVIANWLKERRGNRVTIVVPKRGEKKKLIEMVAENARETLAHLRVKWLSDRKNVNAALEELQEQLSLPRLPRRIECYDISNIQGKSATGSMVVFENGKPKNSDYRRFQIRSVAGPDDYAMMQEVLRRRFKRSQNTNGPNANGDSLPATGSWAIFPDLLIVDGGKGQLNSALEVMTDLGIDGVSLASLAKEKEEIFLPNMSESIMLPRNSQALYLLQRVRDEAHRFAITYHQKLRRRSTMASSFDSIPGMGPKRKRELIKRFGSIKAIKEAPVEELAAVVGMTRRLAEKVKEYL